ncbi:MAG TPA: enolase C-terminal domain-like protein [Candidatus Limnocylindrales bacterium]|nr:enolase C-terminal domain-like protein [Candidatus Limnocylindrales bacterium]
MNLVASVAFVLVPFRAPFETAVGTWTARESWLLRLVREDGRAGWGEAALEDAGDAPVLEALFEELVATGLAPADALVSRTGAAGRAFRAAIGGAMLDLEPPRAGILDPSRAVGVNATIGSVDTAAVVEAARDAVAKGFRTLKLKAGPADTTASLVERLFAVRAATGDDVALRLDVNGTWSLSEAAERLRAIAGVGLQYVEQPLGPSAHAAAATLRDRTGTALAADEAVESVAAARAILEAGAADVLVVKPARVGGPAAVAVIADLAAQRGVAVVISSLFETGVGLAAALACAAALPDVPGWPAAGRDHGLATAELLRDDLLVRPLVIGEGRMCAPGGPGSGGMGVVVDERAVARYRVSGA